MSQSSNRFSRLFSFFRSSTTIDKSQQSSSLSSKTTFDHIDTSTVSEFDGYLSGIPLDIKRRRNKKQTKSVTLNSVKMELLEKCYRDIPAVYFQEKVSQKSDHHGEINIEFNIFYRNQKKSRQSQEKLQQHLDQIEICLFNQVTSRFDEFVAVLRTIEALDFLVKDNMVKLAFMRQTTKNIKKNMLNKTSAILKYTQIKSNKEKVLQKLLILQKAKYSKDSIKSLISKNKNECLGIINQIRLNGEQVKQLKCAVNYSKWKEEYQNIVKKDFTENFSECLFKYITLNSVYNKSFWEKLALRNDLLIKLQQDVSNSTVLFDDELDLELQLEPQNKRLYGVEISEDMESKIVEIISSGWSNSELNISMIKVSLQQHFIQEFQNILNDIREFSYQRLIQANETNIDKFNTESLLEHMSVQFYSKVLQFYSLMLKRYFRRLFSVSKKCINQIIKISITVEQTWQIQRLLNLMQNLFNIQLFIIKSNIDKFMKLIYLKKIGANIDFYRFKEYLGIIQNWQKYFNNQIVQLYNQIQVPADCPIKQRYYVLKNKLNSRNITQNKNIVVEQFFNNLHKNVINSQLKKSLEDDSWQVVDIPTSFYEPISLLLSSESYESKKRSMYQNLSKNQNNTLDSSLFVDKQISIRNRSVIKSGVEIEEKANNLSFKLIKNQCIINSKMYKFTETFLLLIEIFQEYVLIHDTFDNIKEQVASGLLKLAAFYNSYSHKLIVQAGAVHFQKLKTKNITARHLAVSSLCLEFLMLILKSLEKKVKFFNLQQTMMESLRNHHSQIAKKLRSILQFKVTKSLAEVDLKQIPSAGSLSIINSSKALFDIISQFYQDKEYLSQIFNKDIFGKYLQHLNGMEIKTIEKAQNLKEEITFFFDELQFLSKIVPEYDEKRAEANAMIMKIFESL